MLTALKKKDEYMRMRWIENLSVNSAVKRKYVNNGTFQTKDILHAINP